MQLDTALSFVVVLLFLLLCSAALWDTRKCAVNTATDARVHCLFAQADLVEKLAYSGAFPPDVSTALRELADRIELEGFRADHEAGGG